MVTPLPSQSTRTISPFNASLPCASALRTVRIFITPKTDAPCKQRSKDPKQWGRPGFLRSGPQPDYVPPIGHAEPGDEEIPQGPCRREDSEKPVARNTKRAGCENKRRHRNRRGKNCGKKHCEEWMSLNPRDNSSKNFWPACSGEAPLHLLFCRSATWCIHQPGSRRRPWQQEAMGFHGAPPAAKAADRCCPESARG